MGVRIARGTTIGAALHVWAPLVLWATFAGAQPTWVAPGEPKVRPQLPSRVELDLDNNRVDDRIDRGLGFLRSELAREKGLERRQQLAAELAAPVSVEVVFTQRVTQQQIDAFAAFGGTIGHLYRSVSYGWSGTIPGASIDALAAALGPTLLVMAQVSEAELHMDEATRTGRVRPVWAAGYAGSANGIAGTSDITVGVIDSGVDDSHSDLTGRAAYWKDYTADAEPNPRDVIQHGSHVAGIAVGSGGAFGAGPGTLRYTDSGNLTGVPANSFFLSGIHVPAASMTFDLSAAWLGGGSTLMRVAARSNGVSGGFISICNSATAASPLTLNCVSNGNPTQVYSSALPQSSTGSITRYATTVSVSTFPSVGDGFPSFRGVAPGARWAGAKVFTNAGSGNTATIGAAMDDMVTQRSTHNIKVVNMSLGTIGAPGIDVTLRTKANTMVNNGIVVVASAGNDGPGSAASNYTDDPGRAALVLTVGASNDANALTRYTSTGFPSPGADEDSKPDLLAPGGSDYYSQVMSVDSNDADAGVSTFADRVANDYLNIKGTSMAAPFTAGSAALVIDAMQKAGTSWTFSSSVQPLFVKMLLCASSTETNAAREASGGSNPTLGRAATPKDVYEGYGIMNPDAAVEAIAQTYPGGSLGGSTAGGLFDRRAWGRRLGITSGPAVTLTLAVPADADYDLYLYSGSPDAKGNPVVRASSTNAGVGTDESITFTPTSTETRYLFVKRVSGSGEWSLSSGTAADSCGDGNKTGGEQCDDGNLVGGDCCSANCTFEANGSTCSDGLFCTATDTCSSGVCSGNGNPCSTGGECNNSCNESANNCASPAGTACSSDSNACTLDQCNGSGSCAHPAGNAGAVCRAASGICDVQETCSGTVTTCPADSFAGTATTCRAANGICDVAEKCTGNTGTCPADAFASPTAPCRASAGVCDVAESCTGTSGSCPSNTLAGTATVCRSSSGVCDSQETCSGTTAACPADTFASTNTVCRAANGVCDSAERCTGSTGTCPGDSFAGTTTVCRGSAGVCDSQETCSGTSGACPANTFVPSSTTCRAASSVCDVQETCNGSAASCPTDSFAASTTPCRASAGVCDSAETCTGSTGSCPANTFAASTTVCRAGTGICDAAESCSGFAAACPDDSFSPSTTTCRASGGVCDAAEKCTGNSGTCPVDTLASSSTICRPASGSCDVAENCTGVLPVCPADGYALASTTCRSAMGVCDAVEVCSGLSPGCPADSFASPTTPCRASAGVCDVAETCTGNGNSCPADTLAGTATVCRSAAGVCDVQERCSGASASCPADAMAGAATVCRSASGVCDVQETCSGSAANCGADGVASSATTCRASSGECDVAETCDGDGKACPANGFAPADTDCSSDGQPCTEDVCSGSSATCTHPAGNAGTVCRASAGVCDVQETCSGASTSCPANTFAASTTTCRAAGGVCDLAETCSGASAACPGDAVATTAVACRASAGECDTAETCDGAGKSCPANGFAPADTDCSSDGQPCTEDVCDGQSAGCTHPAGNAGTPCRASAGVCDAMEACNGSSTGCPADALAASTTVCRSASGVCDVQENCSGASAACPVDAVASSATTCRASTGECDLPETCNGAAKACVADAFVSSNTGCTSDGNACTNDICNGSSAACQHPNNTASCNDGVFCNGADTCSGGACSVHAGDPCIGPDGDGNCAESCNETGDSCTAPDSDASACNDGLFCTANDACTGGACVGSGTPCPGADGDGNCSESCSEAADACTAADPNASACNDGLFCTTDDECTAGTCVGSGNPCPGADGDGNCAETCNEATNNCTAADPNSSACNDGVFCNGADTCSGGACGVHTGNPCAGADGDGNCSESCNEGADSCNAADPDNSTCNDGLACTTQDACQAGACTAGVNDCGVCGDGSVDDGELCDDGNTASGDCCSSTCTPASNGTGCNDGQFCNGADTCASGACTQHAGDPCPGADGDGDCSEACNEAADACSTNDADTSSCDDGVYCNGADTCLSGACSQHAGSPCPGADGDGNCAESCKESNDTCTASDPDASACDDGLFCNGADTCNNGSCSQHGANPCAGPDGDENCSESCNETADNCTASDANGSACNDGVFCNGADTCNAGSCSTHGSAPCVGADGDGNCAESCNEAADNCSASDENGSACNDNAFCNGSDTCSNGVCSQHTGSPCPGADGDGDCAESCNEGNDGCDAADGNGSPCTDGKLCTVNDSCQAGVCTGDDSVAGECTGTTTTTLPQDVCGDPNEDGRISSSDAQFTLRAAVGTVECAMEYCDYSGDGKINTTDALLILRTAVGLTVAPKCPGVIAGLVFVTSTLPVTTTTMQDEAR